MKGMIVFFIMAVLLLGTQCAVNSYAADIDARATVEEMLTNYYYSNSDGRSRAVMEIVSRTGQTRTRDFVILRKNVPDSRDQFYYVYFYEPSDVRGVVFLVNKHIDRDDDRWLYLPAIDLVRRISANDKRSSFVGSDFTYEDVSGRHLDDDTYEYMGEMVLESEGLLDKRKALKIKAVPKDTAGVEFSYRVIWVDKEYVLPLKVEHYNKRDELYKVFEALEIETIQDTPTITKGVMRDAETGAHTVMEFQEVEYELGIAEDIFTERYLRRPPREWIK